jgi:hypothetical protein
MHFAAAARVGHGDVETATLVVPSAVCFIVDSQFWSLTSSLQREEDFA